MPRIIPKFYMLDSSTNTIYPASEYIKKVELEKEWKIPKYFLQSILDMDSMKYYKNDDYLFVKNDSDYYENVNEDYMSNSYEFNLENNDNESDNENEYNTYQYY